MSSYLAYIAGFFDGEGSVGVYKNGKGVYHLRTQLVQNVSQASLTLLDNLIKTWGGNGSIQTTKSTGAKKFNWQLNSKKAERFLQDIRPFTRLKSEQIDMALFYMEGKVDGPCASAALKILKRREVC